MSRQGKIWTDDPSGPSTDVVPTRDRTFDLGAPEARFKNLYVETSNVDNLIVGNLSAGNATIINLTTDAINTDLIGIGGTNIDGDTADELVNGYASSVLINPEALVPFLKNLTKVPRSQGGSDILTYGDSIGRGGNSESILNSGMFQILQRKLQTKFNPVGTPGGLGFIPVATGSASAWNNPTTGIQSAAVWTLTGVAAYNGRFTTTTGLYSIRLNAASGSTLAITMNGADADAAYKKSGITSFSVVTYGPNSHTSIPYTVFNNTTSTTVASGNFNGFAAVGGKITSLATGLNPLQSYTITVTAPAAGGNVWLNGGIAFNGDELCGIRLHNLCNWGSRLVDDGTSSQGLLDCISGSQVANRATSIASNITPFTVNNSFASNTNTGPTKARLALIEYSGTNDDPGGISTTVFGQGVGYLNAALIAAGITPLWITCTAQQNREATYYPYNDVIIAAANASNGAVAVLDVASNLGRPSYGANAPGGFMYDRGWFADGVHYLTGWHSFYADQILAGIEDAYEYCRNKRLL